MNWFITFCFVDLSKYPGTDLDVSCPTDQLIPIEPTNDPNTTPAPGQVGAPGEDVNINLHSSVTVVNSYSL